jgi:serine/threonine protein kinase
MHGMKPSLIHCNIKPENILLKKCDSNKILIKFADFFIKPITDSNEVENKYIAPECEYSKEYYKESDIFSLGLICQELFHINVNG